MVRETKWMPRTVNRRREVLARLYLLCLLPLFLGCATRGDVGVGMILPATAVREDIREDQRFLFPDRIGDSPMPSYPRELLKRGAVDVVVCVEIVVGLEGAVESVERLEESPECPASRGMDDQVFLDAVSASAMQWQFLAAALCTFATDTPPSDDCSGVGVTIEPRRAKLAYRFNFSAKTGRVETRSMSPD